MQSRFLCRISFLFVIVLTTLSCHPDKPRNTFTLPNPQDINAIVEMIIREKKLYVYKADSINTPKDVFRFIPLLADLRKDSILAPIPAGEKIPPPSLLFNSIYIDWLLHQNIHDSSFFLSSDSLYLLFQNEQVSSLPISRSLVDKLMTTSRAEQEAKIKARQPVNYYELTIPLFSSNKTKAYIELTHHCSLLCGSATGIYLEKRNGEWKVIGEYCLWIS